jgi:hypothetical protein
MNIGAVGKATPAEGMFHSSSIRLVLAHAVPTGATSSPRGEIEFEAPIVACLRRENDVVLDPAEHHYAVLLLIFHNRSE